MFSWSRKEISNYVLGEKVGSLMNILANTWLGLGRKRESLKAGQEFQYTEGGKGNQAANTASDCFIYSIGSSSQQLWQPSTSTSQDAAIIRIKKITTFLLVYPCPSPPPPPPGAENKIKSNLPQKVVAPMQKFLPVISNSISLSCYGTFGPTVPHSLAPPKQTRVPITSEFLVLQPPARNYPII